MSKRRNPKPIASKPGVDIGRALALALALAISLKAVPSWAGATLADLETSFNSRNWENTAEIAHEILSAKQGESIARIRGSYALFQAGYPNSALLMLRQLSAADWKRLPEAQGKLYEVVSLFQKKIPLNLLSARLELVRIEEASPHLLDEIRFAKGREAYERKDFAAARGHLTAIAKGSRFYAPGLYLLAAMAVEGGAFKAAAEELAKIFEPSVLQQSTEFWDDVSAQTSQSGSDLRVQLGPAAVLNSWKVGELATLGLARIAYATKDFQTALAQYERVAPNSPLHARARLERIWTLLAMNRHAEAQAAAAELSITDKKFEAIEARLLRALSLTEAQDNEGARQELDRFQKVHDESAAALERNLELPVEESLPGFLKDDLKEDIRLKTVLSYSEGIRQEMQALRAQDARLFPAFSRFAAQLEPLILQSKTLAAKLTREQVARRLSDLARLQVQARLIRAETYLEDREILRAKFRSKGLVSEAEQREHDTSLVELLTRAVEEVDAVLPKLKGPHPNLMFRQSELLWELSTARLILNQGNAEKAAEEAVAGALRARSLKLAQSVVRGFPEFSKHAQAYFFVGYAQMELGMVQEGTLTLGEYVRRYPKHNHVPDAYRILADLKFDANQFAAAETLYRSILAFPDSAIVGYALYKIGWCAYNRKDFGRALLGMEKAISWSNNPDKAAALLSLKRESRQDLIGIYAEVGDHRKAADYFSSFVNDGVPSWLLDLARQLDKIGQFEKSTDLYKILMRMDAANVENIGYQAAIIRGAYKLHRWEAVMAESESLVSGYRGQLGAPQEDPHPAAAAERALREAVLAQHFEFRKLQSPEETSRILKLDELYLSAFSQWPSSREPLYLHAHLLLRQKKPAEAASAYRDHWARFGPALAEPLREEAFRNVIHALEQAESASGDEVKPGAPLSPVASEVLELSSAYLDRYPNTKHSRAISFLRSALLLKYNDLDRGIRESQQVFNANPSDEFGKRSFKNLRAAYYRTKDWKRVHEWSVSVLLSKIAGVAGYRADLETIQEESLFLWAEATDNMVDSAKLFLRLADNKQSSLAQAALKEKALYNTFIRYQKANEKLSALDAAARLEKEFPGTEYLDHIAGVRAAFYQDAGDYGRALPLFARFLRNPGSDAAPEAVQQARLNAALIAEADDQPELALKLYQEYLKMPASQPSGAEEAKRALQRIEKVSRKVAAENLKGWEELLKAKSDFEKGPLPKSADLAARIKGGASRLEALAKRFFDVSSDKTAPRFHAFESYCAVPFLYDAYAQAILELGKGADAEVQDELGKIAAPIKVKSKEIADQCIAQSSDSEHDGPYYRQATKRWGWASFPENEKIAAALLAEMGKGFPFWEDASSRRTEAELLDLHLRDKDDDDSWYDLARLRWAQKKLRLTRLTLVDALTKLKSADSARFLNGLACVEQRVSGQAGPLFEKAARGGSGHAWANLAYLHLSGGRFPAAINALRAAYEADVYNDGNAELKKLVKEALGK